MKKIPAYEVLPLTTFFLNIIYIKQIIDIYFQSIYKENIDINIVLTH